MSTRYLSYISATIILAACLVGAVVYPRLPEQIASHWNVAGDADGYVGKFWGVFLLPVIMAVMYAVYLVIPRIDPLKRNIESFRSSYDVFWFWMFAFFGYLFGLTISWNLGLRFDFTAAMVPALATLLFVVGRVMEKSKRNWFLGIRTPWTLSSDAVWDKTHALGGRLFKAAAVVSLLGMVVPSSYVIVTTVVPVVLVAIVTVVYSYVQYKKIPRVDQQ